MESIKVEVKVEVEEQVEQCPVPTPLFVYHNGVLDAHGAAAENVEHILPDDVPEPLDEASTANTIPHIKTEQSQHHQDESANKKKSQMKTSQRNMHVPRRPCVESHQEASVSDKIQRCDRCDITFKLNKDLSKHTKDFHDNKFVCRCDRRFDTRKQQLTHQQKFHPYPRKISPIQRCEKCDITFTYGNDLKTHNNDYHNGKFVCRCNRRFKTRKQQHEHQHVRSKLYPCKKCDAVFYKAAWLSDHKKEFHPRQTYFPCDQCDA